MLNKKIVDLIYADLETEKTFEQIKKGNKGVTEPKQVTVNLITKALKRYKELCRLSLLKKTGINELELGNALRFLSSKQRISSRYIRKDNRSNILIYSMARSDL